MALRPAPRCDTVSAAAASLASISSSASSIVAIETPSHLAISRHRSGAGFAASISHSR